MARQQKAHGGWEIGLEPSFTPRGISSCFSNSILIKHMFVVYDRFRAFMAADIQSAYATGLGTSRSPETLNTLIWRSLTDWQKSDVLSRQSRRLANTRCFHAYQRYLTKPWPGPATVPHIRLRVSRATAFLYSGKILTGILLCALRIYLTQRKVNFLSVVLLNRCGTLFHLY